MLLSLAVWALRLGLGFRLSLGLEPSDFPKLCCIMIDLKLDAGLVSSGDLLDMIFGSLGLHRVGVALNSKLDFTPA